MKVPAIVLSSLSCASAFTFVPSANGVRRSFALDLARQPIMAGNWKMNPATEAEALKLAEGLTKLLGEETCSMDEDNELCTEVVIFPPHPFISKVKDVVEDVGITVGAQSIFFEDSGAYTGSVSVSMIESVGCEYVLCGHSERRTVFGDDDEAINRKVKKVLAAGLKPILCIGETKDEYDMDIKNEVCAMQLARDLRDVTKEQMKNVVIAYEPVWAIGTGLVCGAKEANDVHKFVRSVLAKLYDEETAQATRIQYGGSVTPDSVDELMAQPDIDGCLVGGASLVADKFGRIINFKKSD
jgi:triosephosphate isomerase